MMCKADVEQYDFLEGRNQFVRIRFAVHADSSLTQQAPCLELKHDC